MAIPNASQGHRRPSARVRPHSPMRPLWLCRVCAAPWPCSPARLTLGREYAGDRLALSVYMTGRLHDAVADLYRLNPNPGPDLTELFDRFLGWVRHPLRSAESDR